jgi:hypothetical protein
MRSRRLAKILPALGLLALALPASASAQATRTWVSGVGDDANPCSRTAPCKTFAGAISKTANGGEINCLDPGGFGGLTITKSLTIKCHYTEGGALVAGTNGIVVNATANDKVTLKGLDINGAGGAGGAAPTSLSGIKVLSAKRVTIIDTEIYQFKSGLTVAPTSAGTRVVVARSHIHNNGIGVITAPGSNAAGQVQTTLRHNDIQDNDCGVVSAAFGTNASTPVAATDCGAATSATGINQSVITRLIGNGINDNPFGVFGRGANALTHFVNNDITGSSSFGVRRIDGALMVSTTPATNFLNNAATDTFTSTTALAKMSRR